MSFNKQLARSFLVFLLSIWTTSAGATTYHVDCTNGSSGNTGLSEGSPKQTLDQIWAIDNSGGDTVMVKGVCGVGSEIDSGVPSGSAPSTFTRIEGYSIGIATFTGTFDIPNTKSYFYLKNLIVDNGDVQKTILGHHHVFDTIGWKGGGTSGYGTKVSVGENGADMGTHHMSFFDNWSWGNGGRYDLLIFNSSAAYVNRWLARHDGGWSDGAAGNPESSLSFYNSAYSFIANYMVLESSLTYHNWYGGIYLVHNPGSDGVTTRDVILEGCAIIGSGGSIVADGDGFNEYFRNGVFIDQRQGGFSNGGSAGKAAHSTLTNCAFMMKRYVEGGGGYILGEWNDSTSTFTNGILANYNDSGNDDIQGSFSPTYFDTYNNSSYSNTGATGRVTYNPETNGYLYPFRIEAGSALATAGSGGGRMGPEVLKKWGTNGALFYGDTGYDQISTDNLWPWPNEGIIKSNWSNHMNRGVSASTMTITKYFWEWFGNPIPESIYGIDSTSPTAPTNLSTTSVTSTTMGISWTQGTDAFGVTDVRLDVASDSGFTSYVSGYQDLSLGVVTSTTVTGLSSNTVYYFRLRCKDAAGNTSSNSSTGSGTTSAAAVTPIPEVRFGAGGMSAPASGGWRRLP